MYSSCINNRVSLGDGVRGIENPLSLSDAEDVDRVMAEKYVSKADVSMSSGNNPQHHEHDRFEPLVACNVPLETIPSRLTQLSLAVNLLPPTALRSYAYLDISPSASLNPGCVIAAVKRLSL